MKTANADPIVRIAELEIDPAQLEIYRDLLREEIEASIRLEPGVLTLYALSVKRSPASIRILEIYSDQQTYEAHLQSPHFLKYKMLTRAMVRSLHLVETDPLILRSKNSD